MAGELTIPGAIAATTVAEAAAGDADALAETVGAHHDDMARICGAICGNHDLAQDASASSALCATRSAGDDPG